MTDLQHILNNPLLQLGTNLLEQGGPQPGFSNFGQSVGRAFSATQGQLQSQAQADLRRQLVEAQIAELQRPAAARPQTAQSDIGKINLDFQKGFLTEAGRDAAVAQLGQGGVSAFDEKVTALESTGIPRDVAIGIQAGRFATTRDPITGVAQVIDKSSGSLIFDGTQTIPQPPTRPIPAAVPPPPSVPPPAAVTPAGPGAAEALGVKGFTQNILNNIADFFGGDLPFDDTSKVAAQLDNLNLRTIQLASSGIDGRPNVFFQQKIDELLVKPNELFGSKEQAFNRFEALSSSFRAEANRLQNEIDTKKLRPETFDTAQQRISELNSLAEQYDKISVQRGKENKGDIRRFFR